MKRKKLFGTLSLGLLILISVSYSSIAKNCENTLEQQEQPAEASAAVAGGANLSYEQIMLPARLNDRPEQILNRKGYKVSYNKDLRLPNWVAWHITRNHLQGTSKRSGKQFQEDMSVPSPRATHQDYVRSGYDRGHMCPAGDNKWSDVAMEESFLMTNICPQNPNLNRGDWNEMENACRAWAKKYGDLVVVAGPILYKGNHKKIGKNKVVVPEAFFKVVFTMNNGNPKAVGFIYKNNEGNRPKDSYVNSIDQVERITGIDFFPALPDDIENKVEKAHHLL